MSVEELVARLRETCMPPLKVVGASAELSAAQGAARGVPQSPAAYVIPISDSGEPNTFGTGAFQQRLTETWGLVLACREVSDAAGGRATVTIGAVRRTVRAALAGWQPDDNHEPMAFASGNLVDLQNGVVWWLDQYRVRTWFRQT